MRKATAAAMIRQLIQLFPPNTIVGSAPPMQIASGVSVAPAPFSQLVPPTFTHVICEFLGVENEDASQDGYILFPNPATRQLIINIPSLRQNEPVNMFITNVLGQVLYKSAITNPKSEIDVSFFSQGIYFVRFDSMQSSSTRRFVKE